MGDNWICLLIRNLFPNLGSANETISSKLVKGRLISIELSFEGVIGSPAHPFRLRRKLPFGGVTVADQQCFDPRLSAMRPIPGGIELCGVCDLSSPFMASAEAQRARGASIKPSIDR